MITCRSAIVNSPQLFFAVFDNLSGTHYNNKRISKMPTIKDIAKACNVSTATVSYVINGKNTLLPETRERVMRKMKEMNYHPSAVARGLTNKRMNTLGILFDNVGSEIAIWHPYTSGILQGIVAASAAAGYNVTLFTELWQDKEKSLPKLRDQRTDGLIVVAPPADTDILPSLQSAGLKVVTVSSQSGPYGMPSVDVDNAAGIRLAVQHLQALGHQKIAFLGGEMNMFSAIVRLDAFQAALQAANVFVPPEYISASSYQDPAAADRQARRLMTQTAPPTAIVAGNDQIAIAVLNAADALGVSVPEQLSIVGFDDIPDAALVRPALTTVRQPLMEIGAGAAELLLRTLGGEPVPAEYVLIKPALVVRATTAPPPGPTIA
jgi:DNA-binding LacI/PurR family transcriptional regulator